MSPAPLRVAAVEYLNAAPLVEPLRDHPGVRLSLGLPAEVARQVSEDEVVEAFRLLSGVSDARGLIVSGATS